MEKMHWLDVLEDYFGGVENLESYGDLDEKITDRESGRRFSFDEHLKGLVYALLSNQRSWIGIYEKIEEINELFYQFDTNRIKETDWSYFYDGIRNLKCGNVAIKKQMKTLHDNIRILEKIEKDYGTLDKFVTSAGANTIVSMISEKDAKYKLFCVGEALAWEYLRNVGVDGAKPDLHLRRFLSSDRMGTGSSGCATEKEVIEQVEQLSAKTGKKKWLIDALIWEYCRDGYDSICSKDPSCPDCVLKSYCKKKV